MDSSKWLIAGGGVIVAIVVVVAISVVTSEATTPTPLPAQKILPVMTKPAARETPVDENETKWKSKLTPEQYMITRKKGTERAFTGKYWNHKGHGVYKCVCCESPLFDSDAKYDSSTGWPSFYRPIEDGKVETIDDLSLIMTRTEVMCKNCKAHLGHVFDDGPQPTGLRYCINSASLDFEERPAPPKTGG